MSRFKSKPLFFGKANGLSLRSAISALAVSALALTGVVGIAMPANAANDFTTYVDENFNQTGYLADSTSADDIRVIGVFGDTNDLRTRKIAISIEDGVAIARAYKPTAEPTGGFVGSWRYPTFQTPVYDYAPDATFGTNGVLDLGFTGVTNIFMPKDARTTFEGSGYYLAPRILVSTSAGVHTYLVFDPTTLNTCTTSCAPTAYDVSAAIVSAGGTGAVPTGFSPHRYTNDEIYVTGMHTTHNRPFIARIQPSSLSLIGGSVVADADYPTGYQAADGYSFEPVINGTIVDGGGSLIIAGNLVKAGVSTGVLFRRSDSTLLPQSTNPTVTLSVGSVSTKLNFITNYRTMGGSYVDSAQELPFLAASQDGTTFRTTKLEVTSSSNETLLSANHIAGNGPINYQVEAVGTDGGKLRVYTWGTLANQDQATPTHTEIETFGATTGTLSSAVVTLGSYSNYFTSGKMVFAALEENGASKITISTYQSAALRPRLSGAAPLMEIVDNYIFVDIYSKQIDLDSAEKTVTYYECDDTYAGSAIETSTTETPTGCTLLPLTVQSSGLAFFSDNTGQISGNIVGKVSYANPEFVYWSPSTLIGDDSSEVDPGSEPEEPSYPAPSNLGGGGSASTLVTETLQPEVEKAAGQAGAGTITGGTFSAITADIVRVTGTTPSEIQTQAASMKSEFESAWGGTGTNSSPSIDVVNTSTGAVVYGLVKNPVTSQPIAVPAQDVVMIKTDNEAILLAAAESNQPAQVNASGVLVINNGGLVGAAANGFAPNTPGELVIMSDPTTLGTFTTDADGSFSGQALLPAGLPDGDHTVVLVTADLSTSLGVTVEPAVTSGQASPYVGPVVELAGAKTAAAGATVILQGDKLETVTEVIVGSAAATVVAVSETMLTIKLPELSAGTYDLVIVSSFGKVTIQGAIVISGAISTLSKGLWTKADVATDGSITQVKMYAKDPVGMGKIQFMVNGREIAWIRAVDETDPKLRTRTNGEVYLVRTVELAQGKNALEIYLDGVRVWRAAYSLQ